MDQKEIDLIERITQEVVARIQARRAASVSAPPPVEAPLASELSRYIDHTLLKPEATEEQVNKLCEEAAKHRFYFVCVNSSWAEHCARKLGGTGVKVCAVVGFPLGAMDSRAKAFEARTAIANGASEIDMVMNVGALKAGNLKIVREDMLAVRRACRQGIVLKVILETCMLTDQEKVLACQIAKDVEADYVKTSTGFNKAGATVADTALMRRTVGPKMGVKAAGGVRSVVLSLGGPLHDAGQLCDMAKTWRETRFGGGRHMVRVNKIMAIERNNAPADAGTGGGFSD